VLITKKMQTQSYCLYLFCYQSHHVAHNFWDGTSPSSFPIDALNRQGDRLKIKFAPHFEPRNPSEFLEEPLLVRLTEDMGLLPANFTYHLPRFEAERLIARRKATAVGTLDTAPDLVIDEDDFALATA